MGRMAEMQRKLLEQMMGPEAMGVVQIALDWWDPKVCRNHMCGVCPHDIFGNTKMDLGPCPKIHNEKVILAYTTAKAANPLDPRFAAFDQEYQNNIYAFVEDCDRKIRMSQRRLEKTPEENKRTVDLMKEIGEIELSIQGETEEIEQLGEAGKVEESMAKLEAVEALKNEKSDKEKELQRLTDTGGASGHQKLRVCETCGAYLSVLDSDRRLADHFGGKMHLGYHELRKLLEKFTEQRMSARLGGGGNSLGPNQGMGMGMHQGGGGGGYGNRQGGGGGAITGTNNIPVGGGGGGGINTPRGPAPSGAPPSSAPRGPGGAQQQPPHTPHQHPSDPYSSVKLGLSSSQNGVEADSSIVPGHGDKKRREAAELMDDVKTERERERSRERRREERHREEERSSKYDDRERRHRSDRDRERDREGGRSDRADRSDRDRRDRERDRGDRGERERDRDRDREHRPEREREREREHRSVGATGSAPGAGGGSRPSERKEYKDEEDLVGTLLAGEGSEGRERERRRSRSRSPTGGK